MYITVEVKSQHMKWNELKSNPVQSLAEIFPSGSIAINSPGLISSVQEISQEVVN